MNEILAEISGWLLLIVILLVILFGLPVYLKYVRNRDWLTHGEKLKYEAHWKMLKSEDDLRHAVMDADKLLDELLGKKGYGGSLADKLREAQPLFSDYNGLWGAHKLRNKLAHELGHRMSDGEGRRALKQFGRAFKDLGLKI